MRLKNLRNTVILSLSMAGFALTMTSASAMRSENDPEARQGSSHRPHKHKTVTADAPASAAVSSRPASSSHRSKSKPTTAAADAPASSSKHRASKALVPTRKTEPAESSSQSRAFKTVARVKDGEGAAQTSQALVLHRPGKPKTTTVTQTYTVVEPEDSEMPVRSSTLKIEELPSDPPVVSAAPARPSTSRAVARRETQETGVIVSVQRRSFEMVDVMNLLGTREPLAPVVLAPLFEDAQPATVIPQEWKHLTHSKDGRFYVKKLPDGGFVYLNVVNSDILPLATGLRQVPGAALMSVEYTKPDRKGGEKVVMRAMLVQPTMELGRTFQSSSGFNQKFEQHNNDTKYESSGFESQSMKIIKYEHPTVPTPKARIPEAPFSWACGQAKALGLPAPAEKPRAITSGSASSSRASRPQTAPTRKTETEKPVATVPAPVSQALVVRPALPMTSPQEELARARALIQRTIPSSRMAVPAIPAMPSMPPMSPMSEMANRILMPGGNSSLLDDFHNGTGFFARR